MNDARRAPSEASTEWLVPPRSARFAGWFFWVAGSAWVGATVYQSIDGLQPPSLAATLMIVASICFGVLLAAVGRVLASEKGGIGMGKDLPVRVTGTAAEDTLEVAPAAAPIAVDSRRIGTEDSPDSLVLWGVELVSDHGGRVLLGEVQDEDDAQDFADRARGLLGVENAPVPMHASTSEPGPTAGLDVQQRPDGTKIQFRVGHRWGLSVVVPLFGTASLAVGIALFTQVEVSPIAGFLFGPPLGLLGLALLVTTVFKNFGSETMHVEHGRCAHEFWIWGLRVGSREVQTNRHSRARLRPRGANGLVLQVVGAESAIYAAAGVTRYTTGLDSQGALALTAALNGAIRQRHP